MYFTFHVSAKCLLIEHKNKKSKRRRTLHLNKALMNIKKIKDPSYYHLLTEAKIFIEMGLFNYKEKHEDFKWATIIFESLIEKCKDMRNHGHRLCEVLHQYSAFLKSQ